MNPTAKLRLIRAIHTLVWAMFAVSICLIPVAAHKDRFVIAWILIGFVLLEVLVLAANRMRCPLTDVAGQYTSDRQANFDIYLPLWLARCNKLLFGTLYVAGIAYTLFAWWHKP